MNDYTLDLLFPIPVYKTNIGLLSDEQWEFVKNQNYTPRVTGTYGRNDTSVLESQLFFDLKNKILDHLNFFSTEIFKHQVEIYITHSWLNYNPKKSYHNLHRHSNSVYSGAYYINVPENSPNLIFASPSIPIFEITPNEYNVCNSASWEIPVRSGDLVLFPSTLMHEVGENTGDDDRFTLSFNTFLKGEIGINGADNYIKIL
jgi:uncharacterized protein (TIGR02466 family)